MPLSPGTARDTKWAPSITKIPGPKILYEKVYERKRMKKYYKNWLSNFLQASAACLAIPAACLLLWVHWALFGALLVALVAFITKPPVERKR